MSKVGPEFALVLALWGTRYGSAHVNQIAEAAFHSSPGLRLLVLLTDRPREGLDERVRQKPFPEPYDGPDFFGHGYRAKLAVFSAVPPETGLPCVFIDLDSIVVGNLGRIANLVTAQDDLFMLPPAGLGFGKLRRLLDHFRSGSFPVGNSSVLAFHAAAEPNLARTYASYHAARKFPEGWSSVIDDVLISRFGRGRIRAIPRDCAIMLRREFLSRVPLWPLIKSMLPSVRRRRSSLAVVTMNGIAVKPEVLADMPEGAPLYDGRGRKGTWSEAGFGSLWRPLRTASQRLASAHAQGESD